jgi:hypothetical protein
MPAEASRSNEVSLSSEISPPNQVSPPNEASPSREASSLADRIHAQALEISTRYKRAEAELIGILQQAEEHRVFLKRGHSSLFTYVVRELGLSENVAYSLISVARKAREVPALKTQLQAGQMTLTNARRVVAVLTPHNQAEWIAKASTLSNRALEREIAQVHPQSATSERTSYVGKNRVQLELGLSETETLRLRRAQDLLSQARRRPVSLEETIAALTSEYLERHDPIEKAKRHQVRKGGLSRTPEANPLEGEEKVEGEKNVGREESVATKTKLLNPLVARRAQAAEVPPHKRQPIPAKELHRVNFRDRRKCTHPLPDGSRCNQSRWIEIHHVIPVSQGGGNTAENLTTLCSVHHRLRHMPAAG